MVNFINCKINKSLVMRRRLTNKESDVNKPGKVKIFVVDVYGLSLQLLLTVLCDRLFTCFFPGLL